MPDARFLEIYAQTGIVLEACEIAKVGRRTVYDWQDKDPEFARQFEAAREAATDVLERECRRRAVEGVKEPVYYQGRIVGYIRKKSDTCLLALLNAYRPDRFRNRHEHTGKDGGPIGVVPMKVSYHRDMWPDDLARQLEPGDPLNPPAGDGDEGGA